MTSGVIARAAIFLPHSSHERQRGAHGYAGCQEKGQEKASRYAKHPSFLISLSKARLLFRIGAENGSFS